MSVVCIVPAYNESGRIGSVLRVLLETGYEILVVDDGSTDSTVAEAEALGVKVHRMPKNGGKGAAMLAGLRATIEDIVMFVDADLKDIEPRHFHMLAKPVESGEFDMMVGGRDHGALTGLANRLPLISGERAVRRKYLELMPEKAWSGYKIEVWINDTVARFGGRAGVVTLDGVTIVLRWEKQGARKGLAGMVDMSAEIVKAMQEIVEHYEDAPTPPTLEAKCSTTECVADAITESAAKAFEPFWTPEAQRTVGEGVGEGIGRRAALPAWGILGIISFMAAGWMGPALTLMTFGATSVERKPLMRTL
jgi:hypothetical protein